MAPKFPRPAGRCLALLLVALAASKQTASAVSFEHEARRFLQAGERRGMGWVITNFPLKARTSCDATFYHSPLVLNITRPDRSTFCFDIYHKTPEAVKYSCQQPANPGQVGRVQILTAPGCGEAVAGVTVDGRPWSNYTYDNDSSILSIDRIATVPPPDAANPADHIVCIMLRPIPTANGTTTASSSSCGTVTSFCAPTYGPDPACAVLVADNKANCCPVNRISYASARVAPGGLLYQLYGRLTAGCESIVSEGDLLESMAAQYRSALGLPRGSIQFQSYSCRAGRISAVFRATSLTMDEPELILQRSATLLKPLATVVGLVGVRAVLYTAPPPPLQAPSPPPPRQPSMPPPGVPPTAPPTDPSPLPAPTHPNVPARSAPPRGDQPEPSHYASRPPPVYGAY